MAEREQRAEHVLHAYRERRSARRGEDTWYGETEGLAPTDESLDDDAHRQRRMDVIEEAVDLGMPGELAEMMYDIARGEGLDPVLGFELVRAGLGVQPPSGLDNAPEFRTTDKYRPEWLEPPVDPDTLLRERMLRVSFRRLRGMLEAHPDPADAFRAFAREPDVGPVGY